MHVTAGYTGQAAIFSKNRRKFCGICVTAYYPGKAQFSRRTNAPHSPPLCYKRTTPALPADVKYPHPRPPVRLARSARSPSISTRLPSAIAAPSPLPYSPTPFPLAPSSALAAFIRTAPGRLLSAPSKHFWRWWGGGEGAPPQSRVRAASREPRAGKGRPTLRRLRKLFFRREL
ncbi:hypothetical protein GUJ93_ZPchr0001g31979 [Zizania palustris]|uniref:Uncharacterized protein n=1 Tax=Zizania palustris TaxID=103762 RepID=A0A8J5RMY9_ZIZPA|nr:hypothetical protein GUJ93_ZPchr0001g31979 [Zizania palustris]